MLPMPPREQHEMRASWKVVPLAIRHLPEVVDVHLRAFPNFFATFLGPRFLRELYGSFQADPGVIGLVAEDLSGRVLGVVVGPLRTEGYFKRLLRRRWWAFCAASFTAVPKKPTIIPRLVRAICYRGEPPQGPS